MQNSPIILSPNHLIPNEWRDSDPWVSNACMVKADDKYIVCYRVASGRGFLYENVGTPGAGQLRIACAMLDNDFIPVPGSVVPLSNFIKFPESLEYSLRTRTRHEDPRLFAIKQGLYLTWNDGAYGEERNNQFLLKLDPKTLQPIGRAQEFRMTGRRRHNEKNWLLFDADSANGADRLQMVYSTSPFRVLEAAKRETDAFTFQHFSQSFWNSKPYEKKFGEFRGGAAPVRLGDYFYMFGHSYYLTPNGKRYVATVVKFTAKAPFRVIAAIKQPLPFQNPLGPLGAIGKRTVPDMVETVFPCGAIVEGDHWIVSHGINEEACVLTRISCSLIEDLLIPVQQYGLVRGSIGRFIEIALRRIEWEIAARRKRRNEVELGGKQATAQVHD
jgi:predicted GH43/DUF377 family glycosyl hydrolase